MCQTAPTSPCAPLGLVIGQSLSSILGVLVIFYIQHMQFFLHFAFLWWQNITSHLKYSCYLSQGIILNTLTVVRTVLIKLAAFSHFKLPLITNKKSGQHIIITKCCFLTVLFIASTRQLDRNRIRILSRALKCSQREI